ncbi:hypothetical protein [Sphingomonas ginsenosidimutans]|jgi:hypothetical protein|uniref:hypothetical protein n=1 Tax=Sphingomonas ginsenosidimutans TaxID=862134 RepID=UPI001D51F06D|nr:hypothetical protein [Sphingomonas ginsenosidimutans]MBY0301261.1 hypothetical protein [Sphingomonas ginsenosidimutans]
MADPELDATINRLWAKVAALEILVTQHVARSWSPEAVDRWHEAVTRGNDAMPSPSEHGRSDLTVALDELAAHLRLAQGAPRQR